MCPFHSYILASSHATPTHVCYGEAVRSRFISLRLRLSDLSPASPLGKFRLKFSQRSGEKRKMRQISADISALTQSTGLSPHPVDLK